MAIRSIAATALSDGHVLALPFERTGTVQGQPKIGARFVTFRTEHGLTRVDRYDEVLIEVAG